MSGAGEFRIVKTNNTHNNNTQTTHKQHTQQHTNNTHNNNNTKMDRPKLAITGTESERCKVSRRNSLQRRCTNTTVNVVWLQRACFGEITKWPIEFRLFHCDANPPCVQVGFRPIPRDVVPPLPFTESTCRCGRPLDAFVHHRAAAACSTGGLLGREWFCSRECHRSDISGGRNQGVHEREVRDLDIASPHGSDLRCLEVVAEGLTSTRTALTTAGLLQSTVKFFVRPAN